MVNPPALFMSVWPGIPVLFSTAQTIAVEVPGGSGYGDKVVGSGGQVKHPEEGTATQTHYAGSVVGRGVIFRQVPHCD